MFVEVSLVVPVIITVSVSKIVDVANRVLYAVVVDATLVMVKNTVDVVSLVANVVVVLITVSYFVSYAVEVNACVKAEVAVSILVPV